MIKKALTGSTIPAIFACLLWSTAFVGVKTGLEYSSPLHFAGTRFFISGLLILPFTGGLRQHWKIFSSNLRIILLVALLNTILQYTFFYYGIYLVPAALAAIIIGAAPLFIAIMAHFMMPSDKMTLKRLSIFLLGFSGIVLVSLGRNSFSTNENVAILGVILLLSVNLVSGLGNVVIARDAGKVPAFVLSSSSMIIGGASLFLISIPLEGYSPGNKPLEYYGVLAWLSFLSAAAFSIWFYLLKKPGVKVSDLNFWKSLIPVVGAILSWLILEAEEPNLIAFLGMGIVVSSLVALNIDKRKKSKRVLKQA